MTSRKQFIALEHTLLKSTTFVVYNHILFTIRRTGRTNVNAHNVKQFLILNTDTGLLQSRFVCKLHCGGLCGVVVV